MIKNTFHLFWAGQHLSYLRYLTFKTCRMFHPDAEIILHHSKNYSTVTNWIRERQDFHSDMGKNYFERLQDLNVIIKNNDKYSNFSPVYQADFLRWEILNETGGVYLDTDQLILKNFDSLLDCDMFYCSYLLPIGIPYYPIGVLGSASGHWIPQEILKNIKNFFNPNEYQSIGPNLFRQFMMTPIIKEKTNSDNGINDYPRVYFYPAPEPDRFCEMMFSENSIDCDDSYAIHWFGGYTASHQFNSSYTEEKAKTSDDTISTYLRKIGAV